MPVRIPLPSLLLLKPFPSLPFPVCSCATVTASITPPFISISSLKTLDQKHSRHQYSNHLRSALQGISNAKPNCSKSILRIYLTSYTQTASAFYTHSTPSLAGRSLLLHINNVLVHRLYANQYLMLVNTYLLKSASTILGPWRRPCVY